MTNSIIKILFLCCIWGVWLSPATGNCQSDADSVALMRAFTGHCNMYSQLPVQANIYLQRTTNLLQSKEDTSGVNIRFYIQAQGSYLQYGELEQIGNDSLLLLVSHDARRMLLYPSNTPMAKRMQMSAGVLSADSSVDKMLKKYQIQRKRATAGLDIIVATSRNKLYGMDVPVESIEMKYDVAAHAPVSITQVRHNVVAVDAAKYQQLLADPAFKGKLLHTEDDRFLAAKEQTAIYQYIQLTHQEHVTMPVLVNDRVIHHAGGKYEVVKGYEGYKINQNF